MLTFIIFHRPGHTCFDNPRRSSKLNPQSPFFCPHGGQEVPPMIYPLGAGVAVGKVGPWAEFSLTLTTLCGFPIPSSFLNSGEFDLKYCLGTDKTG